MVLERKETVVPEFIDIGDVRIVPYQAGESLAWCFVGLLEE